jgi:large-conductance mechanosensitive channel
MYNIPEIPKLIDSQTGYYLMNTLKQCHDNRIITYSKLFNGIVVFVFITIACIVLYLCFTRKKSAEEQRIQLQQDQKYILEKIKSLQHQKQTYFQEGSMTHLPMSEPNIHRNHLN